MSGAVLLSCEGVTKGFGARPLFEDVSFALFEGDRAGLIGPNGSGKSTLLRILAGLEDPDRGARSVRKLLRLGYVAQDPTFEPGLTVEEVLARSLAADATHPLAEHEAAGQIARTLGRAGFVDARQAVETLSGGWRKRLAIARELVREPDVLLLDEPTNHLDLEGILWLEGVLQAEARAFLVVSHDRRFLENVARRMLELDRVYPKGLFQAEGRYSDFLLQRDELLAGQAAYQAALANKVRREVEWLRRGAPARTTKAKGRIQSAERQIEELAELSARTAKSQAAGIDFTPSDRRTKRLLRAHGLTKGFAGRPVLAGVSFEITRGMKLGLLGPNGSGKTTLLHT
ncbi:MAG TPA: ATP-binding cassette domain-containing protein, partial [Thermoanaerobaculia bacterium]